MNICGEGESYGRKIENERASCDKTKRIGNRENGTKKEKGEDNKNRTMRQKENQRQSFSLFCYKALAILYLCFGTKNMPFLQQQVCLSIR